MTSLNQMDTAQEGPGDADVLRPRLLHALQRVRGSDFSVELPSTWEGLDGRIADVSTAGRSKESSSGRRRS
jgi:hypothetical protein